MPPLFNTLRFLVVRTTRDTKAAQGTPRARDLDRAGDKRVEPPVQLGRPVAFTIRPAGNLIEIVIGHRLAAAGICRLGDPALLIKPDLMEIAVLAGAGVVPPIEIVGKIKGAEVYGILMDYTALRVIFILYIDITLEILNRTEIPVTVIRIAQTVSIWVFHFSQEARGY